MEGYNVDGYEDVNGNGDGYGDGDRTRYFFSQPNPFSPIGGYENFNDALRRNVAPKASPSSAQSKPG